MTATVVSLRAARQRQQKTSPAEYYRQHRITFAGAINRMIRELHASPEAGVLPPHILRQLHDLQINLGGLIHER